jgi:hypothetical protein
MDLRLEHVHGNMDKDRQTTSTIKTAAQFSYKQPDQSDSASDSTPLLQSSNQTTINPSIKGIQLADLLKKEKLYNQKFIDRVDWLDQITFAKLEEIKQDVYVFLHF